MTAGFRVSIYSQDSLGLGHLRRNIVIGGALLEACRWRLAVPPRGFATNPLGEPSERRQ